jgi:hypothetical protein
MRNQSSCLISEESQPKGEFIIKVNRNEYNTVSLFSHSGNVYQTCALNLRVLFLGNPNK